MNLLTSERLFPCAPDLLPSLKWCEGPVVKRCKKRQKRKGTVYSPLALTMLAGLFHAKTD